MVSYNEQINKVNRRSNKSDRLRKLSFLHYTIPGAQIKGHTDTIKKGYI